MFDHPLYREILDDPDDDQSRLVFADWLEEQGDERGEFIRVQVEVAEAKQRQQPVSERLIDRESKLLQSHLLTWTLELRKRLRRIGSLGEGTVQNLISHILYYRGFPSWIGTSAATLLKHGDLLMRTAPWQYVRLNCRDGEPAKLASWQGLEKIRTLTITGGAHDAADLLDSPFLHRLEKLVVNGHRELDWERRVLNLHSRGALKGLQEFNIGRKSIGLGENAPVGKRPKN